MTKGLCIRGAGAVDRRGVAGTTGTRASWTELGVDPLADKLPWKPLFDAPFPHFRHLDPLSRALCIAAEAAGFGARDAAASGDDTALVFGSAFGCVDADWHFQASLGSERGVAAGLFPYTLPSTALGEVAIRHGLRGPTLTLGLVEGEEGRGLEEAVALLRAGEAAACGVFLGDWVGARAAEALGLECRAQIVALLLGRRDPDAPGEETVADLEELMRAPRPADLVTRRLRERGRGEGLAPGG